MYDENCGWVETVVHYFMALEIIGHNFCMLFFIVELVSLFMSDRELKIAWNRKEKKNIPNKRTNKICHKTNNNTPVLHYIDCNK